MFEVLFFQPFIAVFLGTRFIAEIVFGISQDGVSGFADIIRAFVAGWFDCMRRCISITTAKSDRQ
jgi:hypothetical protein